MSFSKLASDIVYQIAGHVVAEYIDTAIATPPRPIWAAPYSKDFTKLVLSIISERRSGLGRPTQLSGSDWTEWSGVTLQEFNAVAVAFAHAAELGATKQTSTQPPGPSNQSSSKRSSGNPAANLQTVNSGTSDTMVDDSTDPDSDLTLDLESDEQCSSDASDSTDSNAGAYSDASDDTESDMGDFSNDSDYESDIDEDERKEFIKEWECNETLEELPLNPIGPLLVVNTSVRKATFRVVRHALGLQPRPRKNLLQEIETLLKVLRKGYRIALTPPFAYASEFILAYKGPETPLIDAYISLSIASYTQRLFRRFFSSDAVTPYIVQTLMEEMKATRYLAVGITPGFLRDRLSRRTHIYDRRFRAYFNVLRYCREISEVLSQLFKKVGPANRSRLIVNSERCPDLRKVVHDLKVFDDKYMDKAFFSLLPRPLIKGLGIRALLRAIAEIPSIKEYRKHEDLMIAAREASALLEKYRRRCASVKTLFVNLK